LIASPSLSQPVLLKWTEYRRSIAWKGERWGFHRATYPEIAVPAVLARLELLPAGQAASTVRSDLESFVLCVEGETEFRSGSQVYPLERWDILAIGPNTPYEYANVSLRHSLLYRVSANPAGEDAGVAAKSPSGVTHMQWREYRREFHWQLPLADTWGSHRSPGPHIPLETLRGHVVRQPAGQSCPWHAGPKTASSIFLQLSGETEFTAAGRIWSAQPLDLFMLPGGVPYIYTNVGLADAFFMTAGPKNFHGQSGVYYKSDPGWPVDPNAPTYDTEGTVDHMQRLRNPER
jgi:quercetin dioxygenase-like cupin family protein